MSESVIIGDATLYWGDSIEILPTLYCGDAIITDPVWPNNSLEEFSEYDSGKLIAGVFNNKPLSVLRAALHLGCDSDIRCLAGVDLPFFRVCWLRYARPHYKGRLLYGSDVAYLFGEPPASRAGNHVISGEVCKTDSHGRVSLHPCERAQQHVDWLVEKWSSPGETVLDPFMGSGTTGISCLKLGRRFIGIEIDDRFFNMACQRIEDVQKQARLFA